MKNKTNLKTINWIIFIIVVLTAIITAIITIYDLYNTPAFGEAAQSRVEFRWGTLHMIISIAILILSIFLAIGWKRLFPFNVPIAIILVGFCYLLFFLTFTVGWVAIQGMLGFFIAFLVGGILLISYSISFLIHYRKTTNKS
ncbi:RND transporter [Niallia sp. XMNu-256]|uniref:RND transporter n=1 Tax=Niallia sp. XMNu-256 TaxID=3082444 RepID=UPI0030D0C37A